MSVTRYGMDTSIQPAKTPLSHQSNVLEFHDTYNAHISKKPNLPLEPIRDLRVRLLKEEFLEYIDAEANDDLVDIADALGDMLYIIYGTAISYGIPLDAIVQEIHRSNMSKLGSDGKPILNSYGKVMKGPKYFRPDIGRILMGVS